MTKTKNKQNKDESHPSNELLAVVKEARLSYKEGKMKSFKNIDELVVYLTNK